MVIGLGGVKAPFTIPVLVMREWLIMGSLWVSTADLREVVQYVMRGLVKYREVVTRMWRLGEINEAFNVLSRVEYVGRLIITP